MPASMYSTGTSSVMIFRSGRLTNLNPVGRALHILQHAVNPVADAKRFGQWFQMNVRGAGAKSFDDDRIDQFDDRRIGIDRRAVIDLPAGRSDADLDFALRDILDHF